jgi:hypothetical protein
MRSIHSFKRGITGKLMHELILFGFIIQSVSFQLSSPKLSNGIGQTVLTGKKHSNSLIGTLTCSLIPKIPLPESPRLGSIFNKEVRDSMGRFFNAAVSAAQKTADGNVSLSCSKLTL